MDRQDAMEEIALIRRVIDESRRFAMDSGKYYLLWGALVTAAIFAEYWMFVNHTRSTAASAWVWIITIGIGWLVSMIWGFQGASKRSGWPIGAKLVGLVWLSSGISMTILGFVATASGALQSWALCPVIAVVMGSGYAISGLIYRLRWVSLVGVAWWLGSLVMFWIKGIAVLPIFGIMMILFQIVPGLVFYRKSKTSSTGSQPVNEQVNSEV